MKNIRYMIFTFLFLFFNIFCVHASCTNDEISDLKDEASKIKITYKHLDSVQMDDYVDYNRFKVTVTNINDDFYITYAAGSEKLVPEKGQAVTTLSNGNWDFSVYSSKCNVKIDSIKFTIPTFNVYSLDPLCEGIDGDAFPLCGKYYEYYVSYEDFITKVTNYRLTYETDDINDNQGNITIQSFLNDLLLFFNKNKLYLIVSIFILLFIILLVTIVKKRKKRGVLQ